MNQKYSIAIVTHKTRAVNTFYASCINYLKYSMVDSQFLFEFIELDSLDDVDAADELQKILYLEQQSPHTKGLIHLKAAILELSGQYAEHLRVLQYYYPNLPIYLIPSKKSTKHENIAGEPPWRYPELTTLVKESTTKETISFIFNQLSEIIAEYKKAPFWDALQAYSKHPAINFHSTPISNGSCFSSTDREFRTYYGEQFLHAETSLSTRPLDSLLLPNGPIVEAQQKAARAFGAIPSNYNEQTAKEGWKTSIAGTRFVTNGTSSANHIVISAFVRSDDFVLIDRNAHISHYNALARSHALPIFLQPIINRLGIPGPVPLLDIRNTLFNLLAKENRLPSLMVLTNPTFDGIFYKPRKVIEAVESALTAYWDKYHTDPRMNSMAMSLQSYLESFNATATELRGDREAFLNAAFQRIVFLFDEAWGSHAFFHPSLIEHTAMHTVLMGNNSTTNKGRTLRVYSTQSTHKTLTAFRQGSMIHYSDPLLRFPAFKHAFDSSFRFHTTTSPNANIVASLDMARKQVQLKGLELIDTSIGVATRFRHSINDQSLLNSNSIFSVVTYEDMLSGQNENSLTADIDDYALDPIKVTIAWSLPVDGRTIKNLLLSHGIQINKYSHNSILTIFNVGIDESSLYAMRSALHAIQQQISKSTSQMASISWKKTKVRPNEARVLPDFRALIDHHNLGYWLKNEGGHEHTLIEVHQTCRDMRQNGIDIHENFSSAAFVTPYPPGFPLLVPGQRLSLQNMNYLCNINVTEVMGVEVVGDKMHLHVYRI